MSNAMECRFCDHCDSTRQNYDGRLRCTKFSTWTNRFSCCEYYENSEIRKLALKIAKNIGGAYNG